MTDNGDNETSETPWWRYAIMSFSPGNYARLISIVLWPALAALFLLGLIQSGITTLKVVRMWPGEVDKFVAEYDKSFPRVVIEDGKMETDADSFVTGEIGIWGLEKKTPLMIDPTGDGGPLFDTWDHGMRLTTGELILKDTVGIGQANVRNVPLSRFTDTYGRMVFDAGGIRDLTEKIKPQMIGTAFIQGLVRFAMSKAMHMFVGTLITLVITGLRRSGVRYGQLVKLGFYALIPATVFEVFIILVLPLFGENLYRYLFFVYVAIYVVFLAMAALTLDDNRGMET